MKKKMKFTHGIWFNREHTLIYNATEVAAVTEPEPGLLRALCTTKHVRHNGDTLNEPTITVKIRGLDEGIIACSATHFSRSGRAEPRFPLFPDSQPQASPASKVVHDSAANLATVFGGSSSATLTRNSSAFNIAYKSAEGKVLTNVGYHSLQYVVAPERDGVVAALEASTNIADPYYRGPVSRGYKPHMVVSLMLAPGEYVYGLGERFGPFIKNGQEIDLWNEDAGTCAPYSKCIRSVTVVESRM